MSAITRDQSAASPMRSKPPAFKNLRMQEAYIRDNSIKAKGHKRLDVVYLGIAIAKDEHHPDEFVIGITAHDGTYSINYTAGKYPPGEISAASGSELSSGSSSGVDTPATGTSGTSQAVHSTKTLATFVLEMIDEYRKQHHHKVAGAGITQQAVVLCPELPSLLWSCIDVVCLVFAPFTDETRGEPFLNLESQVDEESDSVVRKAIEKYGPGNVPRLMVKGRNEVAVDADSVVQLTSLEDYKSSVHANTWKTTMHFADSLKKNDIRIAFFNTTPQGGGVALMRHALIRFLRLLGVKCKWYVPRPNSEIFRITKNNHNILQGVDEKLQLEDEQAKMLDEWCEQNAARYWIKPDKGPLAHPDQGGAHVIIVDDPQMPKLVDIAKQIDPNRPVIFRSHIQVRADRANDESTNTARVWNWVWQNVKKCDVFVSHPVPDFVPNNVTSEKVGYMPATTDWLDGLNKKMDTWDTMHYMHEFCMDIASDTRKFKFAFPNRKYIVQIARFDPAKGIPDVLASYAYLRRHFMQDEEDIEKIPQLVIAGHGAIDDPDALPIYDETMAAINKLYPEFAEDIIVMRVGPSDQVLNVLMREAHVALQLSTREGFEVKVSEALHAGVPIIATWRGGIPLQVVGDRAGYLIERDVKDKETGQSVARDAGEFAQAVAEKLHLLFTSPTTYDSMSEYASNNVSDEVSTIGNALCWLYLADTLAKGRSVIPERMWIHDMARQLAAEEGVVFEDTKTETKLPRVDLLQPSQ
ncbi:hypothetical protein HBH53_036920 [Parastagonospora nodorum]|nr:hypothetical protein HBH53_036920 [Parastagonospora nodorum]KAH4036780.1 hypothetical protein HBI09_077300 [Parastagonospora nodorum]KAH4068321.1 hypothetical protein HBH50_125680 [Parastagonospora nodorum]KAH4085442.1 hypothetical protein HBH48_149470 [Parastagonospora nodorum]KAH4812388.1 hypothetical protein HBH61_083820 [Parastagonospora nodorum]